MVSPACFYHPSALAVGSCSRCGNPACNVCLVMKGSFLSGSSQLCKLCILYEDATNTAGIGAFVTFIGMFFVVSFTPLGLDLGALLLAVVAALLVFIFLRTGLRRRARRSVYETPRVAARFCTNCGRQISQTANFCEHCGVSRA